MLLYCDGLRGQGQVCLLRLDQDMYESTVDVCITFTTNSPLAGTSLGVIGRAPQTACDEFFSVRGIQPSLVPIDSLSAYRQKTQEMEWENV